MSKINIYSEFGRLREIIVGRPLAEEDCIFNWGPGMDEEFTWMTEANLQALKSGSGRPFAEVFPERFAKTKEQMDGFKKALEDLGVTVHQVPKLQHGDRDYINPGIEQMYPRDVWCTAGDTVMISSLRMPWKRKQQFTMAPFYVGLMEKNEGKYLASPQATTDILSERTHEAEKYSILLDGGDFLVHKDEIYLGQGHGSNALGAKFAQDMLGDRFKVFPLKLHEHALHLDCTVSLIREGLGIICRDWLISDLPDSIKDWTWIEATPEEAVMLGVNGLPVAPNKIIFDPYHERLVKEMRAHDVEVVEVPYDQVASWGGSVRCSSQPVYRDDLQS